VGLITLQVCVFCGFACVGFSHIHDSIVRRRSDCLYSSDGASCRCVYVRSVLRMEPPLYRLARVFIIIFSLVMCRQMYIYVYIYTCMYMHTYSCIHIHVHAHVNISTCICIGM